MNKSSWIPAVLLGVIMFLAVFFRFYAMPTIPPSLNWDEVSFGYNAYSILKTGRDEYGKFFPLYFRSLDDYKLPVYTYMTVCTVGIFGLNDFAVRLPSAVCGTLTVLLVYLLVGELIRTSQKLPTIRSHMLDRKKQIYVPLLSSFFLAILPWHIQFSRMAAEATVGLFFFTAGVYAFVYSMRKHHWLLVGSVVLFGLSSYSYLSFRVISPIFGIALVCLYWKDLIHLKKKYFIGLFITAGLLGSILLWDTTHNAVHIRVQGTSVFTSSRAFDMFKKKEQEMFYDAKLKINLTRRFFHDNTTFTSADIILQGYFSHFAPSFLFFDYDQKQHHTPFVGLNYIWMLPLFGIGLYAIFSLQQKKTALLIFIWLLVSAVPASITWDIPHAIRSFSMVIPLSILAGYGTWYCLVYARKNQYVWVASLLVFCCLVTVSGYYFFHQYMIHLPQERSKDWVYGRKELTEYLMAHKDAYEKIIVSTKLEWPHIFLLYYAQYDPVKYLAEGGTVSGGWAEEGNAFDIFEFYRFRKEDFTASNTLFVGRPEEFDENTVPVYMIQYLDGAPAIYVKEGDIRL